MKVAVIGSRCFNDYFLLCNELDIRYFDPNDIAFDRLKTIISGGAQGADALAKRFAQERGIQYIEFAADWNKYGKAAGVLRNTDIINAADEVIAFWDLKSRGTKDSINKALMAGKPVTIIPIKGE